MLLMVCAIDRLLHGIMHSIMERQDLSCTYLAHHELESIMIVVIIMTIIIIIIFTTKSTKKGMHRCLFCISVQLYRFVMTQYVELGAGRVVAGGLGPWCREPWSAGLPSFLRACSV